MGIPGKVGPQGIERKTDLRLAIWFLWALLRARLARLRGKVVVLDADYYRLAVEDFHSHLRNNATIRGRCHILQIPEALIRDSRFDRRIFEAIEWLDSEQAKTLRWDHIHLYEAYRTRFAGDSAMLDFRHSPRISFPYIMAEYRRGLAIYEAVKYFLPKLRPDRVLLFQGAYGLSRLVHILCQRTNQPMTAIENSFLGNRVYFDSLSGMILNRFSLAKLGREFLQDQQLTAQESGRPIEKAHSILQSAKDAKIEDHRSTGIDTAEAFHAHYDFSLEQPFALIIGQVQVDASLLLDSPQYPDLVDFIMDAIQHCRKQNIPVLVRFHPREAREQPGEQIPLNPSYQQVMERLGSQHEDVCLVAGRSVNTALLQQKCKIAITVNSQAGFEAALLGKPVVTSGECLYARKGFTFDSGHRASLERMILEAWSTPEAGDSIAEQAATFLVALTNTCMPRRDLLDSEDIILRQLGVRF